MCISAVMMAAVALQAVGSIQQGQQQQDAADAQAREAAFAAEQARADAETERGAAEVRANTIRKAARFQKSQTRSALAKSGVAADAGTAQTIQDFISTSSEQDALAEIYTGQAKGRRLESEAGASDRTAGYLQTAGQNAMTSGILGAGKSVLSGYLKYKENEAGRPGWKVQQ